MAKTVSDVMVAALKSSGVRRVYGISGDSVNGFTDALRRDGEITWELDLVGALRLLPELESASTSEVHAIARWLRWIYPGDEDAYVGSLQPDVVAEELLRAVGPS